MRRFLFFPLFVLCSCRLEPGAMLGGGEGGGDIDCAHREINAVGYSTTGVPEPFSLGELREVMQMEMDPFEKALRIEFIPRTQGHGLPKLKELRFQRLREETSDLQVLQRKAICQDWGGGDSRSVYLCGIEKMGSAYDDMPFYFEWMALTVGDAEYYFSAQGAPMNCTYTGSQISDIRIGDWVMPTVIPSETKTY